MKKTLPLITLLILSLFFCSCADKAPYRRARFYMGTTTEFNILSSENSSDIEKACDIAESKISALDKMLSIFDEESIVSRINNDNEKKMVKVPPELFSLIKKAKEYFILTQGAFDITVEPLVEIWGFGPQKNTFADIQKVSEKLSYIGLDKISLDEQKMALVFKDPALRIDFGGLAKGYAVDEAVKIFKKHGIANGLINMGGDLYCMGTNSGRDWSIGIRDPENKEKIFAILKIRNMAVATSGTYENFYIYNDRRYSHIIDPRTGYPVTNDIISVTVVADNCAKADALATAVLVLGENKGLKLIERLQNTECFLIVERKDKKDFIMSSGMSRYIEKNGT